MNISPHWPLDRRPSAAAIQELRGHLAAFNVAHSRIADESGFAIFLRDGYDRLLGGTVGSSWERVLEINCLWVSDEARGQGYGIEGYPDDQRKYLMKKRLASHVDLS